jgi:hypothetical protein
MLSAISYPLSAIRNTGVGPPGRLSGENRCEFRGSVVLYAVKAQPALSAGPSRPTL